MKKLFRNVLLFSMILLCPSCKLSEDNKKTSSDSISYYDANQIIYNPDIGFYSAIDVAITKDGIESSTSILTKIKESATKYNGSYSANATFNLLHLKVDISAFSASNSGGSDTDLTSEALNGVRSILNAVRECEKTTVIRFAYDPGYKGKQKNGKYLDYEPKDFSKILKHIKQLCPVLKEYSDVITAIECGMLGPWGEMHSTTYGEDRTKINQVVTTFLDELNDCDIPLLVRQPSFIYKAVSSNYSDLKKIPDYTLTKNSTFYKLGIYNDGYLGSKSDSGTFKTNNRAGEVEFLKQFTDHTPYGGELIGTYGGANAIPEMYDVHLSFLNIGWNENVLKSLCNKSEYNYNGESYFNYIIKHMGYRYVLTKSEFTKSESNDYLKINLTIQNNGFANMPMHRTKNLKILFVDSKTGTLVKTVNLTETLKPFTTKSTSLELGSAGTISLSGLTEGTTYKLYLKVCNSDGKYPIQFANPSSQFDSKLKGNLIGEIEL